MAEQDERDQHAQDADRYGYLPARARPRVLVRLGIGRSGTSGRVGDGSSTRSCTPTRTEFKVDYFNGVDHTYRIGGRSGIHPLRGNRRQLSGRRTRLKLFEKQVSRTLAVVGPARIVCIACSLAVLIATSQHRKHRHIATSQTSPHRNIATLCDPAQTQTLLRMA
jgi:hypothetical protein